MYFNRRNLKRDPSVIFNRRHQSLQEKLPSSAENSPSKYSYKIRIRFKDHHIIGKNAPLCISDKIPDKSPGHKGTIILERMSEKKGLFDIIENSQIMKSEVSYKENTEELLKGSTKSKHVSKVILEKLSPRKELFKINDTPFHYNPKPDPILLKTAYCILEFVIFEKAMHFAGLTGREENSRLSRNHGSPDFYIDYDCVYKAYDSLGHLSR